MNVLKMKNGSVVRADCVVAIRSREPLPQYNLGPAVIVDFTVGKNGNSIINECADAEEQRELMSLYTLQIGA